MFDLVGRIIRGLTACVLFFAPLVFSPAIAEVVEMNAATPLPTERINMAIDKQQIKIIALTFDDGPSLYTKTLLDILESNRIKATFCVLGERVILYPEFVRRASELGCDIVGHSWDHTLFIHMNAEQKRANIINTYNAITEATGKEHPRIFRAPGGNTSEQLMRISEELGFMALHWTLGTADYVRLDTRSIRDVIYYTVKSGSIILCHDIIPETIRAMRILIPELLEQGYTFVTISEYINFYGDEVVPGTIYRGH